MPKADGAGAAKQMAPELINWTFAGLSMTDDADTRYWQTHNSEAYKAPVRPQTQGSSRPKHQHSNISQWDLGDAYSAAPPDVHFRTANNLAFSMAHPVQHARPRKSEQYAESFERTRVPIGSTNGGASQKFMKEDMYATTNEQTMGAANLGRRDKSQPIYVRETAGAKRVASTVLLDRNIPEETRAPFEKQSASSRGFEWPHTIVPPPQRHERPQKNYSTFLKPSGAIAEGVGGYFASFTDHKTVNPGVLSRTKPACGTEHYRTAYMSHYTDVPRKAYVAPGSEAAAVKAKQDAFQAVQLGMGHDTPWSTQARDAYRGIQHGEEDRAVQIPRAMRGSLGARQLSLSPHKVRATS